MSKLIIKPGDLVNVKDDLFNIKSVQDYGITRTKNLVVQEVRGDCISKLEGVVCTLAFDRFEIIEPPDLPQSIQELVNE